MQEISIIVIAIITIHAWTHLFTQTFCTSEGFRYKYHFARTLISSLDFKPLNCAYCLSFWSGLILSVLFMNPVYMIIFLFNVLKTS